MGDCWAAAGTALVAVTAPSSSSPSSSSWSIGSSLIDATSDPWNATVVGLTGADASGVDASLTGTAAGLLLLFFLLLLLSIDISTTTGDVAWLAGEMAGVGGVSEPNPFCQMVRRYSPSMPPPYWSAIASQNFGSLALTSRLSFSLSIDSGLQCTRSGLVPLATVCRRGEAIIPAPEPDEGEGEEEEEEAGDGEEEDGPSAGLGRRGLPLILDCEATGVPGFWTAPAAFTGEKLGAMKDLDDDGVAEGPAGLVAGLWTDAVEEFDEMELFLLRRLPPWDSWW